MQSTNFVQVKMVSDFRKKKLLHIFNAFFDTNRSGAIDRKDFELAVENIAKFRGWKVEDANYEAAKETLLKVWEGIQSRADANNDGEVSQDEWIALWDEYAKNPSAAQDWQNRFVSTSNSYPSIKP